MSAALEPEQDTVLALKLMGMRKTASDEEFGKLLSELLGTCRKEGFRIAMKALEIILKESTPTCVHCEKPITEPGLCHELHPAKYKHKGAGVCIQHGAWQGPLTCPKCAEPHITPMRTKEDALAVHRRNHPELYNEDGTRKERHPDDYQLSDEELERVTRPDSKPTEYKFKGPTGKARKVDDAGRADIQRRAKQARTDNMGRYPKGFIRRLAEEYGVSDALIYNIIYSEPGYEGVPKT